MMVRHTLAIGTLALLAACGGENAAEQSNIAAIENEAGLGGPVVELPVEGGAVPPADDAGAANDAADAAPPTDDWIGRWVGVEGLVLDIARDADRGPGSYTLTMQYTLDDRGTFDGVATPEGIAFTRPDGDQVLRATDGDATGLKYLAGKSDCLTVKQGEGYCRD